MTLNTHLAVYILKNISPPNSDRIKAQKYFINEFMPTPSVPLNLNEWDVKHGVSYKKKVSIEIIGVCCIDREIQFWLVLDATWLMTNDFEVSVIVESAKESKYAAFFLLMMLVKSVRRQFGIESLS